MNSKLETAVFRWANAWMRHFDRTKATTRKDTSCMARSARRICERRDWDYDNSTIGEETRQVRDLFC